MCFPGSWAPQGLFTVFILLSQAPGARLLIGKLNIKRISHMHCRHTHTETHTQLLLIALTTVRSPASCLATGKSQGPKPKHLTFASLFWAFRQQQYSWQEDTMMVFFLFFWGGVGVQSSCCSTQKFYRWRERLGDGIKEPGKRPGLIKLLIKHR